VEVSNLSSFVNEIHSWPIAVSIGAPRLPVIIQGDRIRHIQAHERFLNVVHVFLVVKLGSVDTNHYQAVVFVSVIPFPHRGNYVDAVNSAKGPELNQDYLALQVGQLKRFRLVLIPDPRFPDPSGYDV
jgi:hypothetical protein